jgi:hypothetical protein
LADDRSGGAEEGVAGRRRVADAVMFMVAAEGRRGVKSAGATLLQMCTQQAMFSVLIRGMPIMKPCLFVLALCISLLPLDSWVFAQEKPKVIEAEIKLGLHKLKMEAGTLYTFEIVGDGYRPGFKFSPGELHHPGHRLGEPRVGPRDNETLRGIYVADDNAEHTLVIWPPTMLPKGGNDGTLKYTVTMTALKLDNTPLLTKDDKITANDPVYFDKFNKKGTRSKSYPVKLKADQICVLEMTAKGDNTPGGKLVPVVIVESADKKEISRSGFGLGQIGIGSRSTVMVFRAQANGEYSIIATGMSQNLDIGEFALKVRTVKNEK